MQLLVLGHFLYENYHTNFYIYGLYYMFILNTFDQPNVMGAPNSENFV
jgi:hypothetical protein